MAGKERWILGSASNSPKLFRPSLEDKPYVQHATVMVNIQSTAIPGWILVSAEFTNAIYVYGIVIVSYDCYRIIPHSLLPNSCSSGEIDKINTNELNYFSSKRLLRKIWFCKRIVIYARINNTFVSYTRTATDTKLTTVMMCLYRKYIWAWSKSGKKYSYDKQMNMLQTSFIEFQSVCFSCYMYFHRQTDKVEHRLINNLRVIIRRNSSQHFAWSTPKAES